MDLAPDLTQFGWCPFAMFTGEPCILCGGTRAIVSLGRGDFIAAIGFNAVVSGGVVAMFVATMWMMARDRSVVGLIGRGKGLARRIRAVPLGIQISMFGIWWVWNIGRW